MFAAAAAVLMMARYMHTTFCSSLARPTSFRVPHFRIVISELNPAPVRGRQSPFPQNAAAKPTLRPFDASAPICNTLVP